jgi:hypothetical protein
MTDAAPNRFAFSFGAHCELVVTAYRNAVLSIPAIGQGEPLQAKDLLKSGEAPADGKFTLEEHLECLRERGTIDAKRPMLVFGARNSLVNLRCPAVHEGHIRAVEGENPENAKRPYYGIGFRDQHFLCEILSARESDISAWDFFCAGIPVLWDELDDERLFDLMLCETADHSHLFDLPRGNHPAATDSSRSAWERLHQVFVEHLYSDQATASAAMRAALRNIDPPLRRCGEYFHAVMGTRDDGALVALFALGRLEDLGKIMRRRGCRRAVCLENSGSIMPTFLPRGMEGEAVPLTRAPNFRARGRAIIVIELEGTNFSHILSLLS